MLFLMIIVSGIAYECQFFCVLYLLLRNLVVSCLEIIVLKFVFL